MGVDYSHAHAAILLSQLPADSRLLRAEDVDFEWSQETYFLAQIEYDLRILIWQKSKDGQRGRNKPQPPTLPREERSKRRRTENFDKSLVDRVLGGLNG